MTKYAYVLDLLVVLVFAAIGRATHDLSVDVVGVLQTVWPFLVGLVLGWVAVVLTPRPFRSWWADGLLIAAATLIVGMLLRWAVGEGTALPFVLVASGVVLVGLVGWRAVAALVTRPRAGESMGV